MTRLVHYRLIGSNFDSVVECSAAEQGEFISRYWKQACFIAEHKVPPMGDRDEALVYTRFIGVAPEGQEPPKVFATTVKVRGVGEVTFLEISRSNAIRAHNKYLQALMGRSVPFNASELGKSLWAAPAQMAEEEAFVDLERSLADAETFAEESVAEANRVRVIEETRARDLRMLNAILNASQAPYHQEAFGGMREGLDASPAKTLSDKQRRFAESVCYDLELFDELRDEKQRSRPVPRGREVAPAPVLRDLPKAPPGRRPPTFPVQARISALDFDEPAKDEEDE